MKRSSDGIAPPVSGFGVYAVADWLGRVTSCLDRLRLAFAGHHRSKSVNMPVIAVLIDEQPVAYFGDNHYMIIGCVKRTYTDSILDLIKENASIVTDWDSSFGWTLEPDEIMFTTSDSGFERIAAALAPLLRGEA